MDRRIQGIRGARRKVGALPVAIAAISLVVLAVQTSSLASGGDPEWKGAETFTQTSLVPAPARCGSAPPNVRASFAGNGVDTIGGAFTVTVSACLNTETLRVFDLEATDTYLRSRDSVIIAPDDFTLVVDPETCIATNAGPVAFRVRGGTGAYQGASGRGQFDFAVNWTPCNGLTQPTHVWFRGVIHR